MLRPTKALLRPLASSFDVFASDFRGHGFTRARATPKELSSWQVYEDDLQWLVETIGKPTVLLGHSFGAIISLAVAARNLPLVAGVILVEPVILPPLTGMTWSVIKKMGLGHRLHLARQTAKRRSMWASQQAVLESYKSRRMFSKWPENVLIDYIEGGFLPSGEHPETIKLACEPSWESQTFAKTSHTVWRDLKKASCPLKIVYGTHSTTFSSKSANLLKRHYPHVELVPYLGEGHFLPMERPDCLEHELNNFRFRRT